ncbi:T9SS type A sorting domain-containing protein [Hymenobacter sp. BT635]|uniref:T9SS type A sorting domain-containing protein n=1 Tax=Hymenobacter nitidus TaxID=2880929 RepID=A0ABS8AJC5_9BACT|nr:T9SS type A sorting domain-containing protein [Hymenobacter nitidus]MCB2380543.1 T9SS type A sorting domain-containing protein [Hymenobacter nitidus]
MPTYLLSYLTGSLLFAASLSAQQAQAQAPTKQWEKSFGGSERDNARVVRATRDGGVIVGGISFSSPGSGTRTQANRGLGDYWIHKLDAQGNTQWERAVGGIYADDLYSLEQTPDGGYLLAGDSGSPVGGDKTQGVIGEIDYWFVKLDANGNKLWDKVIGGNRADFLHLLSGTRDGGYIVGGNSVSDRGFDKSEANKGDYDYWIVKLDATGNRQWDRTLGTSLSEAIGGLQQTSDGGYLVGGDGRHGRDGDKTQVGRGNSDMWVVKLSATGTTLWDKTYGTTGSEQLTSMWATPDGGALLGGSSTAGINGDKTQVSRGSYDCWLVKIDANGIKQWDRAYGGPGSEAIFDIYPTPDGGYILGCGTDSGIGGDKSQAGRGGRDFWIIKIDATGTKQWERTLGTSGFDFFTSVRPTTTGGYIIAGDSDAGIDGDKISPNYGRDDYWVIMLNGTTTTTTTAASRSNLSVYPTPAQGHLTLHLPDEASHRDLKIRLVDATGRIVYAQAVKTLGRDVAVEVGAHPAGLYFLRLEGADGYLATQRVILE